MFGKKKEDKKSGKGINNILLGVIIGGAIGSVVGMTVAPEEGKTTRKKLGSFLKRIVKREHKSLRSHKIQRQITLDQSLDQEVQTAEDLRKIPHD